MTHVLNHTLAIARREIEERAFVFVAAIAIAVVSPLALLTPYGSLGDRKAVVVILAFFLALAFTWGLALILGATLIGRELSERRLSFYFTRPISGAAIWFGKLIAAIALLAISFGIVSAFPLAFGETEFRLMSTLTRPSAVAYVLAIGVLLILAAHLLSTWIRSRSPILALDFIVCIAIIGLVISTLFPLATAVALRPGGRIVSLLVAAIVVGAVGGGAWQLSRGRIDARLSHRALSTFFWGLLAAAALTGFVYSRWVLAASPREILQPRAFQRGGSAIQVWGVARGADISFVVNPENGAWIRDSDWQIASRGNVVADFTVSPSFDSALRVIRSSSPAHWLLRVTRLERQPKTLMQLDVSGDPGAIAVTEDGSRVAAVVDRVLTVYDTATGHGLASARVAFSRGNMQFVSPDVVRMIAPTGAGLLVNDFDVRTRKSHSVIPPVQIPNQNSYQVAGATLMVRNAAGVHIWDLNNPTAEQTIPLLKENGVWLMRDGRLAIFHRAAPLYIEIQRNGVQQRLIHFDRDATDIRVSAEIGRGKLLVRTSGRKRFEDTTYIVDADSGTMSAPMQRTTPAFTWPADLGASDPNLKYRALMHFDTGKIDVIDLQTGAMRPLFSPRAE